jgi:hypothetical protein
MAQSASYIYGSVSTTNWQSDNTESTTNCIFGNPGVSYFSSGMSLGCTNISIGPSGTWLGSANIFAGPSGTALGSTNIFAGSSGAWLGRPSTNQTSGFISPSYGGAKVERGDILTTGETRILPEPLNRVISYPQDAFVSAVAIAGASIGSAVSEKIPAWRGLKRTTQSEQGKDALPRQGRIRIVPVSGSGTVVSVEPQVSPFVENETTPQASGGLERALRDLEDFSFDDWDGEGARAISPDLIREAARLLSLLPDDVSEPEVAPASDGSICLEWDSAAGSLWLDIGPDRTAQTLIKTGALKEERRFRVDAPDLAIYLRMASARLYPSRQDWAIRSVMVAA